MYHASAIVCFLVGSAITPLAIGGQGNDHVQQEFVNAFLMARKGEEQEKAGDLRNALATFRSAAGMLIKIKKESPGWQTDVVDFRLKRTMDALDRIQTKLGGPAANGPGQSGR